MTATYDHKAKAVSVYNGRALVVWQKCRGRAEAAKIARQYGAAL